MNSVRLRIVLTVVALAVVGVSLLDEALPPAAPERPEPVAAGVATSGSWYCAVGDADEGNTLSLVAAASPGIEGAPAEVAFDLFAEGRAQRSARLQTFPDSAVLAPIEDVPAAPGVAVRWWQSPVAVTRVWDVERTGAPSGRVTGPCEAQPSATWFVPGIATAGGAEARLVLANPFDSDATVAVTFLTPDGPLEPTLLENVVIPRRSVREILLNEHAPERPDLGVQVVTRAGRVIVEGVQSFNAAIGGVDGVSLLKAARSPQVVWTVPWFATAAGPEEDVTEAGDAPDDEAGTDEAEEDDDGAAADEASEPQPVDPTLQELLVEDDIGSEAESWLWVSNPSDLPASVLITVHTPEGGALPESIEELTVPPGAVRRVDLRGVLGDATRGGITVRSDNDVPIVASVASQFKASDEARTGLTVQLGAPSADSRWVLPAGPTAERESRLQLVNPGADDAGVSVAIWNGSELIRPPALQQITVAPGVGLAVNLSAFLGDVPFHAVFVTAVDGEVVAGLVEYGPQDGLEPVAVLGVPSATWSGGRLVPQVARAPGLTNQVGTAYGPSDDPLDMPSPTPAPDDEEDGGGE